MDNDTIGTPGTKAPAVGARFAVGLDVAASMLTIALLVFVGISVATRSGATGTVDRTPTALPHISASMDGAVLKGRSDAKVVMVEYSDFQCHFCARFAAETLPTLLSEYVESGKVLFAFRSFPLGAHSMGVAAASAAACAGRQGKFWQAHDYFFAAPSLTKTVLDDLPRHEGLEATSYARCLAGDVSGDIAKNATQAKAFSLDGTPTFQFGINNGDGSAILVRQFNGARPIAEFRAVVNELLAGG